MTLRVQVTLTLTTIVQHGADLADSKVKVLSEVLP